MHNFEAVIMSYHLYCCLPNNSKSLLFVSYRMGFRTLFIFLSLMLIKSTSSAAIEHCRDDGECGDGKYCYLKTKTCTDCLKCNAYRRRDKFGSCAKEPLQCGDCLPGYVAISHPASNVLHFLENCSIFFAYLCMRTSCYLKSEIC